MVGRILIGAVKGYQLMISPWTPPTCRFTPSCSSYAIEAIEKHGSVRGTWLALKRIGRCHPWGGFGFDPVPPRTKAVVESGVTEDRSSVEVVPR